MAHHRRDRSQRINQRENKTNFNSDEAAEDYENET